MTEYGLITAKDAETLSKTLELVCENFSEGIISTVELGVRDGRTSRGIHGCFQVKDRVNFHVGIDNDRDLNTEPPFPGCHLIKGNSMEVYNQLEDNSQHFLFIDACHSYAMTMMDFLLYSNKIKKKGFVAFHDCGPQIPKFKDYQGMGPREDPDSFISCRKAVAKLGLLTNDYPGWKLIFDESDPNFDTGGIIVVQKIS